MAAELAEVLLQTSPVRGAFCDSRMTPISDWVTVLHGSPNGG